MEFELSCLCPLALIFIVGVCLVRTWRSGPSGTGTYGGGFSCSSGGGSACGGADTDAGGGGGDVGGGDGGGAGCGGGGD